MPGHIEKRSKSSWRIVLDLGRDPVTAKRVRKVRSIKGTRRDAEKLLRQMEYEAEQGTLSHAPERLTVAEFMEQWLSDIQHRVTPRTHERYTELLRKRVLPSFGHVRLARLQPVHIQEFYNSLLRPGARKDRRQGGLSPRTVLHHHRVIREALQAAVRLNLIPRNPADAANPPAPRQVAMRSLDLDGVRRLLAAMESSRYYPIVFLAVMTGMRQGEILGMRWNDVDWEGGAINISQSLHWIRQQGLVLSEPKTPQSRRRVAAPLSVLEVLRRHRNQQAIERAVAGPKWVEHGLVFTALDGTPLHPNTLSKQFYRIVERAGVGPLRFHDLRHTHATLLLKQGVHPKIVSERLGHSTIGITLDTYSHVLPGLQEAAATQLETALLGTGNANVKISTV